MAHVAIMIRIIPSENRNMYFRMIQDSDTTFKVEMGRVGAAPYVRYYPLLLLRRTPIPGIWKFHKQNLPCIRPLGSSY